MRTSIMVLLLTAGTAFGQGDCTLQMSVSSSQFVSPNCQTNPGFENVAWSGTCEGACGWEQSEHMSLRLDGDCKWGSVPCSGSGCQWEWGDVGYVGDYAFSANGWDGQWSPCTWCDRGTARSEAVYCTWCGHPCWEPIIISLRDARYRLTDSARGVWFDLTADGEVEHIPWTDPRGDEAFLVLDRNRNGVIDNGRELFSHVSPQPAPLPGEPPHGFRALGVFDETINGGNEDGLISSSDRIFRHLQMWQDLDHDGETDLGELASLGAVGLTQVALDYTDEGGYVDQYGNDFHFWATVTFGGARTVPGWAVFFGSP